jgi:hypothetical protein
MTNYMDTILKAIEKGSIQMGGLLFPEVAHDSWCAMHKDEPCNCNPEISVETEEGLIILNKDGSIKTKI